MATADLAKLLGVSTADATAFVNCLRVWTDKGQTVEQAIATHMATLRGMVNGVADYAMSPLGRALAVETFFPAVSA